MDDRDMVKLIGGIIGRENVADDCALLPFSDGGCLVASTDMLHETTDFPKGMTDWQIGWMSVAVTISDIAGMGASPRSILLAIGLDEPDRLNGIMQGAHDCCTTFGAEIAGGDTDHHTELTIVSTGIGVVMPPCMVHRSGSSPGDLICITGTPGCAQAGLEGYKEHLLALLEPQPCVRYGELLGEAGVSAMMDVSDGLVLSLFDFLSVNECGYSISSDRLPLPKGVPAEKARQMALYGGGDFGLLFTCPRDVMPVEGVTATVIGEVTEGSDVLVDGVPAKQQGYCHEW